MIENEQRWETGIAIFQYMSNSLILMVWKNIPIGLPIPTLKNTEQIPITN